jgi:hypothetical protein
MRFILLFTAIFGCMIESLAQTENESQGITSKQNDLQINLINGSAEIQKNIEFESIEIPDLYNAIDRWVTDSYNSSGVIKHRFENKLIQIEGVEPGIVLFKFPRSTAQLKYTLNIEIEDKKLCFTMRDMQVITELNKYTFENYNYEKGGSEIINKQTKRVSTHASRVANVLVNSLNAFFAENGIIRKWH